MRHGRVYGRGNAVRGGGASLPPIAGYDGMSVEEASKRLNDLSAEDL